MTAYAWQTDRFSTARSYLTGRTLVVNEDSGKFLIPTSFTTHDLRQAMDDFDALLATCSERRQPSRALQEVLTRLRSASTVGAFGAAIDGLLATRPSTWRSSSDSGRVRDVLVRLWQAGCLVWPAQQRQAGRMKLGWAWGWGAEAKAMMAAFRAAQGEASATTSGVNDDRLRAFMILVLARGGVREVGDLTPEVTGAFFHNQMKRSNLRHGTAAILLTLQQAAYGEKVTHSVADFGRFGRPSLRADDGFAWALAQDPSIEQWRALAQEFMGRLTRNVPPRRTGLNAFLDYLIAHPSLPRIPTEYLRFGYAATPPFAAGYAKTTNVICEFFDFILDTRCITEDSFGNKVRQPGFRNPLTPVKGSSHNGETHRTPMPTRFVRMLHGILTENDFAWPKAAGRVAHGNKTGRGDWFIWIDPATGEAREEWSPVRTVAILIKLLLPARTYQVRVLDSGEGDSEVYRPSQGGWTRNTGPLAPKGKQKIARGVLHRHQAADSTEKVFLRFNTNKTADLARDAGESGFVMPWQHAEAISLLAWLRDWQERFNPIIRPTRWEDIAEMDIASRFTRETLARRGEACFLFRNPLSQYKDQPVTDARLTRFWRRVCAELEARLAAAGETLPDGSPITLVERRENGDLGPAVFDLHSLRVTLITALAEAGGVPADVLMKVVGHASIIMTLYYEKLSPVHISEKLSAAEVRIQRDEQVNWQRWLVHQSRETLLQAVAHVSPSGIDAVIEVSPSAWVVRDHGICPVGCTRCSVGGEKLVDTAAYERWAEVPGGSSNCVRCRFFITGPAFLYGLQAHFDAVGLRLREASEKYQAAKTCFEALEAEYQSARERGEPVPKSKLNEIDIAAGLFDQQTQAVDDIALSWHATYKLIQQCLAILRRGAVKKSGPGFALVSVGGRGTLEAVLEESTEIELADRVCQAAVFFAGIDAKLPNLKRMRAFDAMLKRNGYDPVFVEMTEEDALAIGNQMAAFLYTRHGRENANALMAGRETLRRLGIEQDFIRFLEGVSPVRVLAHRARISLIEGDDP
jgi:hypothetical protein